MTQTPARLMTDAAIDAELAALDTQWEEFFRGLEGKSGSPGEWIAERMDELETEKRRRLIGLDGDIGRALPRI